MTSIKKDFTELIGNTPLLDASRFSKAVGSKAAILAKLENMNPGGSAKDRVALSMIEDAEKKGILKENAVIIEPTSGNTGIGLAAVAVAKGYKVILTMPETMSVERRKLLKAYGAEIVLTPGDKGMAGAIEEAEKIANNTPDSFIPSQFDNQANPEAHRKGTGPEIWQDTDGKVDIFVATVGTGGTLTGAGEYLKKQNPNIKVVAVEPASSNLLSGGKAGPHKIQGIGANFVPRTYDASVVDKVIAVSDEDAYMYTKLLAQNEGILAGISSGCAIAAAVEISRQEKNKKIVVLLPDSGNRYFSTGVFE